MLSLCIVELHITAINIKYWALRKKALKANLCLRQKLNVVRCACEVPEMFVRLKPDLVFLDESSRKSAISNFTNIHPMGAELIHTEILIDMTKIRGAFRDCAKSA